MGKTEEWIKLPTGLANLVAAPVKGFWYDYAERTSLMLVRPIKLHEKREDASTGAGKANLSTADYKCECNCLGCIDKVERAVPAVKACDGVEKCTLDRKSNVVRVVFGNVDPDKIKKILKDKTNKEFQLLPVQSRAPAVRINHKEDKTEQKNEKKTGGRKTKVNTVQVEIDMKITGSLKIKGDSVAIKFAPFAITARKQERA